MVREASKFQSDITLIKEDREANAKKLFALMSLAVKSDDKITVKIEGSDEETAASELEKFFKENL